MISHQATGGSLFSAGWVPQQIVLWLFLKINTPIFCFLPLSLTPITQDYEAFFEARENNAVYAFLGLTAPPGSKVGVYTGHSTPQPVFYTLFFSAPGRIFHMFLWLSQWISLLAWYSVSRDQLLGFHITATTRCCCVLVCLEDALFPGGIFLPLLLPEKLRVQYWCSFGVLTVEPPCNFPS